MLKRMPYPIPTIVQMLQELEKCAYATFFGFESRILHHQARL
jgi:hypothetical protein